MPINSYREAFKTGQITAAHLIPGVFMYVLLLTLSTMSGGNINLFFLNLIMAFLISFDLTLVVYVLFLKIKTNAGYIALGNHVYSLTLYSKSYVKKTKPAGKIKGGKHT
jgi:hypothetical protein